MLFQVVPNSPDPNYYRAQLPNGRWGLFFWNNDNETMEHLDVSDFPPYWEEKQ